MTVEKTKTKKKAKTSESKCIEVQVANVAHENGEKVPGIVCEYSVYEWTDSNSGTLCCPFFSYL